MGGIIRHLDIPEDLLTNLLDSYFNLDFFGHTITAGWMVLVILISIVLFATLIVIFYSNKRTNFFTTGKKFKKQKKSAQKSK